MLNGSKKTSVLLLNESLTLRHIETAYCTFDIWDNNVWMMMKMSTPHVLHKWAMGRWVDGYMHLTVFVTGKPHEDRDTKNFEFWAIFISLLREAVKNFQRPETSLEPLDHPWQPLTLFYWSWQNFIRMDWRTNRVRDTVPSWADFVAKNYKIFPRYQ